MEGVGSYSAPDGISAANGIPVYLVRKGLQRPDWYLRGMSPLVWTVGRATPLPKLVAYECLLVSL